MPIKLYNELKTRFAIELEECNGFINEIFHVGKLALFGAAMTQAATSDVIDLYN